MVSIIKRFSISLSRLIPQTKKKYFRDLIKFSGKSHDVEFVLGFVLLLGFLLFFLTMLFFNFHEFDVKYYTVDEATGLFPEFDPEFDTILVDGEIFSDIPSGLTNSQRFWIFFFIGVLLFFLPFFIIYVYYFLLADKRTKFVEKILPDALSLISSNMNSGLTAYHAVKSAIRDDFGPLANAFEIATNKSISNKSFNESLFEISDNFNSKALTRSMKLFSTAVSSGSNVSLLLKSLARDLTERQSLKNDLITSTMTNSMFIMFMVIVGGPLLMAISIFFVDVVSNILGGVDVGSAGSDMGFGGKITISTDFLTIYAYFFFFITGFLVAYFTGTMIEGDGKVGLKKAPLIISASYLVFFIAQHLIVSMLGGMF